MSASTSKVPSGVPDGTAATAVVRAAGPTVVGEEDVAGVVQGPRREDRGALVGTVAPAEPRADQVRVAAVEGGGAGVLGIAGVRADAESETPAVEGEGAPAGAGAEAGDALVGSGVLLVVLGGESAVAAQDQGRDVQPPGLGVAGGGSGHHSGAGLGAGGQRVQSEVRGVQSETPTCSA